jgi:DNA-directed RNA polymerases I, II, and III subunit RPABC1
MQRSYQTCLEILNQREYNVIEKDEEKIIGEHKIKGKIVFFFSDSLKFNVKNIQIYMNEMDDLQIFDSVIVYKKDITSFTKKTIEKASHEMKIVMFAEEDLQYNITKHVLQPKFIKLNQKESEELKNKFESKFSVMKKIDPIARFYGYNRGDLIKVIRKSGYVTYRIVK